jgi:hypothetical protein
VQFHEDGYMIVLSFGAACLPLIESCSRNAKMLLLSQRQGLLHTRAVAESVRLLQLVQVRLAYFLHNLLSLEASVSQSWSGADFILAQH